ncbi:MAG: 3-deoxy-manno-octulosonate cytidylyltransferase [Magnetococcales bacterium]|nr:3-deoxy-manno-octulosonate cytidylyltransferase [Magnetococcales bacterium]
MGKNILVIIPSRYASTRLPGKPLIDLAGKPMIQHVYERASQANVSRVVVATDSELIANAVNSFGGEAIMTSPDHRSGTDRVAEAARETQADLIINVQGDEPLLDPNSINQGVAPLLADETISMGTLAHPMHNPADMDNPNVVKVVTDQQGFALYFSRSPIPFNRNRPDSSTDQAGVITTPPGTLRHIGLYVYRADFLQKFAAMAPTPLEQLENLEQLRALEHGYKIRVVSIAQTVVGVDTPDDAEKVRAILEDMRT